MSVLPAKISRRCGRRDHAAVNCKAGEAKAVQSENSQQAAADSGEADERAQRHCGWESTIAEVSRLGIEPRTLGLKGRTSLSEGVARIRKPSPTLDKPQATIPSVGRSWHRLRSRLLAGC